MLLHKNYSTLITNKPLSLLHIANCILCRIISSKEWLIQIKRIKDSLKRVIILENKHEDFHHWTWHQSVHQRYENKVIADSNQNRHCSHAFHSCMKKKTAKTCSCLRLESGYDDDDTDAIAIDNSNVEWNFGTLDCKNMATAWHSYRFSLLF